MLGGYQLLLHVVHPGQDLAGARSAGLETGTVLTHAPRFFCCFSRPRHPCRSSPGRTAHSQEPPLPAALSGLETVAGGAAGKFGGGRGRCDIHSPRQVVLVWPIGIHDRKLVRRPVHEPDATKPRPQTSADPADRTGIRTSPAATLSRSLVLHSEDSRRSLPSEGPGSLAMVM